MKQDYTTTTTATVVSSAGDAALNGVDTSTNVPGHLVNGSFSLAQALQAGVADAFAPISATPLVLKTWPGPTSNEAVTVNFKQSIGANDAVHTDTDSKTLTFTLSTSNP